MNVVLPPGDSVTGSVIPEIVNPVPDAVAPEIVVAEVPVLVSVSVCVEVVPAVMLLKVRLASEGVSTAFAPTPDMPT